MRSIEELTENLESGWEAILEEIALSPNKPEIIPASLVKGKEALVKLQMTSRSYLGAVVLNSGGLISNNGLIRIFGSGSSEIPDLSKVNQLTTLDNYPDMLVIGYDVFGGVFALDGGGLGIEPGTICFLSVDTLEWAGLDLPYSQFLSWLIDGSRIEGFYDNLLWEGWQDNVKNLPSGYGFHLYPPPSTTAWSQNPELRSIKPVPLLELGALYHGMDVYSVE